MKSLVAFFTIYLIGIHSLVTAVEPHNFDKVDKEKKIQKNYTLMFTFDFSLINYIKIEFLVNSTTGQIVISNCETCKLMTIFVNESISDNSLIFNKYKIQNGELIICFNNILSVHFVISIVMKCIRNPLINFEDISIKNDANSMLQQDNHGILEGDGNSITTKILKSMYLLSTYACKYSTNVNRSGYALDFAVTANEFFTRFFHKNCSLPTSNLDTAFNLGYNVTNVTFLRYQNEITLTQLQDDFNKAHKQNIASTIIREWYNMYLSMMKLNWKLEWTNIAFATYLEYFSIAKIDQTLNMEHLFIHEHLQPTFDNYVLKPSRPIIPNDINSNQVIETNRAIISKASSLIRMLHLTFGSLTLKNVAQTLFYNIKYQMSADDLWSYFQDEIYFLNDVDSQLNIKTAMDSWTKQAGYPVLTVTIKNSTAELHQSKFCRNEEALNCKNDNSIWWIPVTWTSRKIVNSKYPVTTYWLNKKKDVIDITDREENQWIIFNYYRRGLYRVNYDKKSWELILKTLNSDSYTEIPIINRAAIIDDLLSLAKINLLPIELALHGLEYIKRETSALSIRVALKGFWDLHRRLPRNTKNEVVDDFIYSVLLSKYNYLNKDIELTDDRSLIPLKMEINELMDSIRFEKCIYSTTTYLLKFNHMQVSSINQKSFEYCSTINTYLNKFGLINLKKLTLSSAIEKPLTGLSSFCVKSPIEIQLRLTSFKVQKNKKSEYEKILDFKAIANCGQRNAEIVLQFLIEYEMQMDLFCQTDAMATADMIFAISRNLNTHQSIEQLKVLITKKTKVCKSISDSLQLVMNNTLNEFEFFETKRTAIINWIKEYNYLFKTIDVYNFLLPMNVHPVHYAIKLTPHILPDKFYFIGEVEITIRIIKPTNTVLLNIDNLDYKTVSLKSDSHPIDIIQIYYQEEFNFLGIVTADKLTINSIYTIEINYMGYLNKEKTGFYRDFYVDNSNRIKWFAATNLELGTARKMFPCFDEPFYTATFQLSVSRTANFKAISNTKLTSTVEDDRYLDIFEKTKLISTHQVALLLSEFDSVEEVSSHYTWMKGNVSYELMYPTIQKKNFIENIENMLDQNESYDYTHARKFSQLKNQLENWNLVAYKDNAVITNPDYVSVTEKIEFNNKWTYEILYRFISNHIRLIYWKCEWSNRALAQKFLSIDSKNKLSTKAEGDGLFVVHQLQPSMLIDALPSSLTIARSDFTPNERQVLFDEITMDKGTSIVRMIQSTANFGSTRTFFQRFMEHITTFKTNYGIYINQQWVNCFGIIQLCNTIDLSLYDNLPENSNQHSVSKCLIKKWINQTGFPVLNVTINNGKASLNQARFLLNNDDDSTQTQLWEIPITWTSSLEPNFENFKPKNWLLNKSSIIEVDNINNDGWIIFNIQQTGYYRVNYDKTSWGRITQLLNSNDFNKIHEINRASLIDDAFNLARAGYVDYTIALKLITYLFQESSYVPWKAALNNLAFLDKRIVDQNFYTAFKYFNQFLFQTIYNRVGFEAKKNESYYQLLLRTNIIKWACKHDYSDCIEKSLLLFNNWKANSSALIPVNLREIVFCSSIKHGNADNWKFLWNEYQETNYKNEKNRIIKALACTDKSKNLNILLSQAIEPESEIKFQDSLSIFSNVYSSGSLGVKATLNFMTEKFDNMFMYYKSYDPIKSILKGLSPHLISEELISRFDYFIQSSGEKLLPISETIESCVMQAQNELKWFTTHKATISKYFDRVSFFKNLLQ